MEKPYFEGILRFTEVSASIAPPLALGWPGLPWKELAIIC
jgi:hypothetical protein